MFLHLLIVMAVVFALVSVRYLMIAGSFFLYFWKYKKADYYHLRIQDKFPSAKKIKNEIKWSFSTFGVFAIVGALVYQADQSGITKIYHNISDYGIPYFLLSILIMLLIHDTYFYWMHRFIHLKPIFKYVHKIHHESTNPSPMAAFAFHPLEALSEALIVPIIISIMPVHMAAIFLFLVCMTVMNAIGHLGFEIYPAGFTQHKFFRIKNTPTHHNMHHKYFNYNYGLYLNFWDTLMKTNHPKYHETFEMIKQRKPEPIKESRRKIILNKIFSAVK